MTIWSSGSANLYDRRLYLPNARRLFPDRPTLWADHMFEPLLDRASRLFRAGQGTTRICPSQRRDDRALTIVRNQRSRCRGIRSLGVF